MDDSNSKTNKQKRLLQNIMKQNEKFSKGLKKLKGDFLKKFYKIAKPQGIDQDKRHKH